MTKQTIDDEELKNYLLGLSSESKTERFDEISVADDEVVNRLSATENDLVDAYVRGELSSTELAAFSTHYLASPMRKEKVAFAKSFLALADKSADTAQHVQRTALKSERLERRYRFNFFGVPCRSQIGEQATGQAPPTERELRFFGQRFRASLRRRLERPGRSPS